MESVASSNTQADIKICPVFAGRNKAIFHEYKSKLRACLSLYSKPVFEVFQGKVQSSSTLQAASTHQRLMSSLTGYGLKQTKTSGACYFSSHPAPPTPFKSLRASGRKMERGTGRWRGMEGSHWKIQLPR